MAGTKKGRFSIIMFIIEALLLLGTLALLLLFGPPAAINEVAENDQGLKNTPEPLKKTAGSVIRESDGVLIVLDASGIDDGGYFKELADSINKANNQSGQYIKCEPGELTQAYEELVGRGAKPTVVMGADELIANIKGLADLSGVYGQLYFNEAADRCVTKTTLPLALRMYAYYFRMDIMHDIYVYVPRSYLEISEASTAISAKNTQLKTFAFEPGTNGCQLMLQQMARTKDSDIYEYIGMLAQMREKGLVLEDFAGGNELTQALCDGSVVMAFGSGDLYLKLLEDKAIGELVQVKPYLGGQASYPATVISCAITSGKGFDAAQNYLIRLFRDAIDEIIIKRNTHLVNPGMAYSLQSPWADVLTDGDSLIIMNENMLYSDALMDAFGYGNEPLENDQ